MWPLHSHSLHDALLGVEGTQRVETQFADHLRTHEWRRDVNQTSNLPAFSLKSLENLK